MNSYEIYNKAKNSVKTITIRDETNEEREIDIDILPTKTVGFLKNEIERQFNLNLGALNKIRLKNDEKRGKSRNIIR